MPTTELTAEPSWQAVDFISDLHLQASERATFNAWEFYMWTTPADAVFILGDLFEVWVGDDVLSAGGFEQQCARVIQQTAARVPTFFMHGNRDFLVSHDLMGICGSTLLNDPTVLTFNHQRWLLSHGDALCIDDTDYMAFRQQVRSAEWQQKFLARPLTERQAIARALRQQSQTQHETKKQSGAKYADVDAQAAQKLLIEANATTLIHGHTHRPAEHDLGNGSKRVVLSDWDMQAKPARAEVMRLSGAGLKRLPVVNLL